MSPRLQVLAVNSEGSAEAARRFVERLGGATVLVDDGTIARRYGVQTLPHLVVVGRDGRVRHVQVGSGGDGERALRARVEEALVAR